MVVREKNPRTSNPPEACHRCGGLMVPERSQDRYMTEWRCVSCGDRIDPVILAHRAQYQHEPEKDTARERTEQLFTALNLN